MNKLFAIFQRDKSVPEPIPAGVYHFQSPANDPANYRLHLRVEPNGAGILVLNASTVLHLNATAVEYAYHLINRTPPEDTAKKVSSRYRVKYNLALSDFNAFKNNIDALIATPDLDPVTMLGFDRHIPYTDSISAPYRLDLALTYNLPKNSDLNSAPQKRVDRELSTEEWKTILDTAWNANIPHVIFTGGEPTLRDDLVELIQYAESKGQVTGLLTDGRKFSDTSYLNKLLQAGLDHVMIILHPDDAQSWESLASFKYWSKTLDEDIFVAAHLTLTQQNAKDAHQLLNRLANSGISAISLSTSDTSLNDALQELRGCAADLDIPLIWDLPVPYSNLNPVSLELEKQDDPHPDGAGHAWLYVEPDGDILPGQGITKVIGNLLRDDWESIWAKAKKGRVGS